MHTRPVHALQVSIVLTYNCVCDQIMVREQYQGPLPNTCYDMPDVAVFFLDGGLDAETKCSSSSGGCEYTFSRNTSMSNDDMAQGIQYGPFEAGPPNVAEVRSQSVISCQNRLY